VKVARTYVFRHFDLFLALRRPVTKLEDKSSADITQTSEEMLWAWGHATHSSSSLMVVMQSSIIHNRRLRGRLRFK